MEFIYKRLTYCVPHNLRHITKGIYIVCPNISISKYNERIANSYYLIIWQKLQTCPSNYNCPSNYFRYDLGSISQKVVNLRLIVSVIVSVIFKLLIGWNSHLRLILDLRLFVKSTPGASVTMVHVAAIVGWMNLLLTVQSASITSKDCEFHHHHCLLVNYGTSAAIYVTTTTASQLLVAHQWL